MAAVVCCDSLVGQRLFSPGSSSFATLPVVSVTTARRSYSPSATSVVLHEVSYGGEMSAAPMFAQLLAPAGEKE